MLGGCVGGGLLCVCWLSCERVAGCVCVCVRERERVYVMLEGENICM